MGQEALADNGKLGLLYSFGFVYIYLKFLIFFLTLN